MNTLQIYELIKLLSSRMTTYEFCTSTNSKIPQQETVTPTKEEFTISAKTYRNLKGNRDTLMKRLTEANRGEHCKAKNRSVSPAPKQ